MRACFCSLRASSCLRFVCVCRDDYLPPPLVLLLVPATTCTFIAPWPYCRMLFFNSDVCWIKGDVLEAARRAFGTDEDIIAVAPADALLPSAPRPPPPLAARGGGEPPPQQPERGTRPTVSAGATTVYASTVTTTGRP